jgi:arylsulfatase A-like enzyme
MRMLTFRHLSALFSAFYFFVPLSYSADSVRPNIILVVADDLGFMDIGANNPGSSYETPHIDALAKKGTRFTNAYSTSPVCSPSRFSLITGRYPSRANLTNYISEKNSFRGFVKGFLRSGGLFSTQTSDGISVGQKTIADAMNANGYSSFFIGKWHLGNGPQYKADKFGFDTYSRDNFTDTEQVKIGSSDMTGTSRRALTFLRSRKVEAEPFFLMMSLSLVHTPLRARQELVDKYVARGFVSGDGDFEEEEQVWYFSAGSRNVRVRQSNSIYAAMVETLDHQIGLLTEELASLGLDDNTIIIFTSDNGGLSTSEDMPTSNYPLRAGKGWLYEGGIKVPLVIFDPRLSGKQAVSESLTSGVDIFPTVLDMTGVAQDSLIAVDGSSLVGDLMSSENLVEKARLYWHFPHYSNEGGFPGGAIREGKYKYIERFDTGACYLFDLNSDPAELTSIAGGIPAVTSRLQKALHGWYEEVDAQFPHVISPRLGVMAWEPATSKGCF